MVSDKTEVKIQLESITESQKLRVYYIIGRGRSGSTYLEQRIGVNLGATMVGELRLWPDCFNSRHVCGCGEVKTNCDFWSKTLDTLPDRDRIQKAFQKTIARNFVLTALFPRGVSNLFFTGVSSKIIEFYQHLKLATGVTSIIDSSKNPAYALLLDDDEKLDLFVIHLVRNPLGVVYSWKRQRSRPQNVGLYRSRKTLIIAAIEWSVSNFITQIVKWRLNCRVVTVQYESLDVFDLNALCSGFPKPVEEHNQTRLCQNHVMSGNPGTSSQKRTFVPDVEWETGLHLWEKILYGAITYPVYFFCRPKR